MRFGRVDGHLTPALAGSIGDFLVDISPNSAIQRPPMVGMNRGERGLSIGIDIIYVSARSSVGKGESSYIQQSIALG